MYILQEQGVANDIFRSLFALLDKAIYSFIPILYNLIEDLAHVSILTMTEMDEMAGRIYTLLGLFMLFKVSFSIITYIINPDKMLDKQTGMQNVIKNVIIVLIMIISVPAAFQLVYDAQSAILEDQVIPKFILGYESEDLEKGYKFNIYPVDENGLGCSKAADVEDTGNYVSLMVFRGFFQLEPSAFENVDEDKYNDFLDDYCYENGDAYLTVNHYTRNSDIYNKSEGGFMNDSDMYYVDYKIILSTAVGVVILLLFVSMCFDVASRSIKLTFLQLISPIPIISYIDPNSGKQGMFKKWVTEVLKTWANLFIRLAAIYFAIYLIQELNNNFAVINNWEIKSYDWVIDLFLIIGILFFAKQLPSLIEELIPGMKSSGSFSLNPFKKVSDGALGGKFITGAAVGAGAMGLASVGAAGANLINSKLKGNSWGKSFGSAARGLGTGAFYGARAGFTDGKNGKYNVLKTTGTAVTQSSKHRNYEDMLAAQGDKMPFRSARQSVTDKITDFIGYQGSMGGTNIVKNKVRELNEELEQEQGRENQYNTAFGNLSADNPSHVPGYVEAGRYKIEKNPDTGNFEAKMQYQSYSEYMAAITGDQCKIDVMRNNIDNNLTGTYATQQDRNNAIEAELANQIQALYGNNDKYITEKEFKDANSISRAVADSSAKQKQIKSDIKKIESNQNSSDKKG